MKEIQIIMEALSKMGEGAQLAFIWWCAKEAFADLMCPVSLSVIGVTTYKSIINGIKAYNNNL